MWLILTVQTRGQGVVDINDNDLPVGLAFIQQGHDTKNLDLLDLADSGNLLANLDNINRIVVTTGLSLRVGSVGIFPGLSINVKIQQLVQKQL